MDIFFNMVNDFFKARQRHYCRRSPFINKLVGRGASSAMEIASVAGFNNRRIRCFQYQTLQQYPKQMANLLAFFMQEII